MDVRKINENLSVCDQIHPSDLPLVHSLGYRSVICNRPDGEDADQPLYASIAQCAQNSELKSVYIPVAPTGPTKDQVDAIREVWESLPKPVLAYCRSGGRSTALMSLALSDKTVG